MEQIIRASQLRRGNVDDGTGMFFTRADGSAPQSTLQPGAAPSAAFGKPKKSSDYGFAEAPTFA